MQKQINKIQSHRPYAYVISVHERSIITIHQTVINGVGKTAYPKVGECGGGKEEALIQFHLIKDLTTFGKI